jgi:hypothetical protein
MSEEILMQKLQKNICNEVVKILDIKEIFIKIGEKIKKICLF